MHLIDVFRISSQPGGPGQPKPFPPSLKYIDVINHNFVSLALDPCLWEVFEGLCALGKSYATFKVSFLSSYRSYTLFPILMRSFPLSHSQSNEHHHWQKISTQRYQLQWSLARDSFRLIKVTEATSFIDGNQI